MKRGGIAGITVAMMHALPVNLYANGESGTLTAGERKTKEVEGNFYMAEHQQQAQQALDAMAAAYPWVDAEALWGQIAGSGTEFSEFFLNAQDCDEYSLAVNPILEELRDADGFVLGYTPKLTVTVTHRIRTDAGSQ
jgi:hypothetical protein